MFNRAWSDHSYNLPAVCITVLYSLTDAPSVPDITVRPNNEDGVWKASTRVVFSCSLPTEGNNIFHGCKHNLMLK